MSFFQFFLFSFFDFIHFSFIYFHFLSFSFIFFHVVGCSKSDFFWASISIRFHLTVLMKKSILGRISGVCVCNPFGPSFFFPPLFSRFFSCFLFFIFSHVLFISSFSDFSMVFHFLFFVFSKEKKFLLFFFSCISFKYFLLLAFSIRVYVIPS